MLRKHVLYSTPAFFYNILNNILHIMAFFKVWLCEKKKEKKYHLAIKKDKKAVPFYRLFLCLQYSLIFLLPAEFAARLEVFVSGGFVRTENYRVTNSICERVTLL